MALDLEGIEVVGIPIHVACASAAVLLVARFGTPPLPGGLASARPLILPTVVRSFPLWIGFALLSHFTGGYWFAVSNMVRPGAVTEPAIDYSTWAMAMPYAGGGLGYLVSLAWLVRRRLHAANHRRAPHNDPLIGAAPVCVRCGYEAAADRPCPECGLENPLALRRVYFGRWHARLMLSRWRWVAVLPWVAVVVLFFWPLISGVARHWLG